MLEGDLYKPQCLIKYLDDGEPLGPSALDWAMYAGGQNTNEIEYLALDPIERIRRGALVAPETIDHEAELVGALTTMRIPFVEEKAYLWIYGYRRASVPQ